MGQDNEIYKCSIKLSFSSKGQKQIKATETKVTWATYQATGYGLGMYFTYLFLYLSFVLFFT